MAQSVRADCSFLELRFIVFGIFLSPHMIATFPSLFYLFCHHPPTLKIAKQEALHPGSGLLHTVTPERPFVILFPELLKRHYGVFGA